MGDSARGGSGVSGLLKSSTAERGRGTMSAANGEGGLAASAALAVPLHHLLTQMIPLRLPGEEYV